MKFGKLQIIIIAISIAAAIFAVLVFSGAIPGYSNSSSKNNVSVTMWGPLSGDAIIEVINNLKKSEYGITVSYQQKNPETFEEELIDALAQQKGPDLVIFPSEFILPEKNKLLLIPYESVSARLFADTFVDGTDILMFPEGIIGLPILVDPILLYWNKDMFRNDSIASSPKTWNEFLTTSQTLTKYGDGGAISRSGSALGIETNVNHFKEIISLLVLQTGSPIIEKNTHRVNFSQMEQSLRFLTQFSDQQKFSYSWAKSFPQSKDAFAKESLAMYFGFGSEFPRIREQNPHLNFDVSPVPQILGGNLSLTYGKFYSVGILKQSKSYENSLRAAQALAAKDNVKILSEKAFMAPSRRDLLGEGVKNPVLQTIVLQAIKFRTWLDADYKRTSQIFGEMIKSVYTGAKSEGQATRDAKEQFDALYPQQ